MNGLAIPWRNTHPVLGDSPIVRVSSYSAHEGCYGFRHSGANTHVVPRNDFDGEEIGYGQSNVWSLEEMDGESTLAEDLPGWEEMPS